MKILFFISGLTVGGKQRRLLELMKGLKQDPSVSFELLMMDRDVHYKDIFDLNIKIHFLIRKKKNDISIFKELFSLCKKIKPDIIHCWDSMTAIYSVPVCKLLSIKLVNGMVINSPEKVSMFDKAYRRAKLTFLFSDFIIGNSKAGLQAYKAPVRKSECIHNGFNFERLGQLESVPGLKDKLQIKTKFVIGMVASFTANKDYRTFFNAAQLLLKERKDITFLAIGLNTDSIEAKEMIPSEYAEHFRLLGKRSDVESLINLMDIAVLATYTEGISNAILEYMALAKPSIATDGGGTKELVVDGITGFLVTRSNVELLLDKMKMLLSDNNLRLQMGKAGRERIVNHFSIEQQTARYISIYKRLSTN